MKRDGDTPATCAYCPAPLASGYPFTVCATCARDVQALAKGEHGETTNTETGEPAPVDPMPLSEPIRRALYAVADPRRLAAVAAGREPTVAEWREWTGLGETT